MPSSTGRWTRRSNVPSGANGKCNKLGREGNQLLKGDEALPDEALVKTKRDREGGCGGSATVLSSWTCSHQRKWCLEAGSGGSFHCASCPGSPALSSS
mmetsp:Transcript_3259/g.6015  ORF Transcript_3259/g.6015 Transcript_3259/m.6015 type:complete len:98 (-) Transcript_3259:156-449(-)